MCFAPRSRGLRDRPDRSGRRIGSPRCCPGHCQVCRDSTGGCIAALVKKVCACDRLTTVRTLFSVLDNNVITYFIKILYIIYAYACQVVSLVSQKESGYKV